MTNRNARVEAIQSSFAGIRLPVGRLRRQQNIYLSLEAAEAIHARIAELSAMVVQGTLVADDLPHTGWGIPAGYESESGAWRAPGLSEPMPEGAIPCGERFCRAWAEPDGENLWRCGSGHLTIAQTPDVVGRAR